MHNNLPSLPSQFKGKQEFSDFYRKLYSTDASAYREVPLGVVFPEDSEDIRILILWANKHKIPLIPRTAGTSLAGQVVGAGLVVDVSKTQNKILEINTAKHWARVEPGVVRDELNMKLASHGLMFAPETSTSNRCMLGGMLGNNSCGGYSIVYGTTREHTLEVKGFLSDGTEVIFKDLTTDEFKEKCTLKSLEGDLYRHINALLSQSEVRDEIENEFPHKEINRRNTGYALDQLAQMQPFSNNSIPFNFTKLIAGSEGTLFFTTELKVKLVPVLPPYQTAVCVHVKSIREAALVNLELLEYKPLAVELIDDHIINLSKGNALQVENARVLLGNSHDSPDSIKAIVVGVYYSHSQEELENTVQKTLAQLQAKKLGYYYPIARQEEVDRIWEFRKAGLGTLANMPGDDKPVPVIEDAAIRVNDYPNFLEEFELMMHNLKTECVYYAHIGAGCMHIRPIINMKTQEGRILFHIIGESMSRLVKKYRGSLSSEHGDGRLRGEFIPYMVGENNYNHMVALKKCWDPNHILNPGKIVLTKPMNANLRGEDGKNQKIHTYFDWSESTSFQHAVEKCNGSGDCRKSEIIGGAMCPTFMVTHDEAHSTRGRANILREFFVYSTKNNPLNYKEIKKVMELCLSCKACKRECPSNVDMTKLKAEFLQHYYKNHRIPLSELCVAYLAQLQSIGTLFPALFNWGMNTFAPLLGFTKARNMPSMSKHSFYKQYRKHSTLENAPRVILLIDEFTNYTEPELGLKAVFLLENLGYEVHIPHIKESGRTYLSKGLVKAAQKIIQSNVAKVHPLIGNSIAVVGIEPSAILGWRDEYPNLAKGNCKDWAIAIAKKTQTIEEFLCKQIDLGAIVQSKFTNKKADIHFHVHCHQRALSSPVFTQKILSFPENYTATEIKSGCCGMAGAFGYAKKNYEMSLAIGELKLFPAIRNINQNNTQSQIAASGTSCRHQIFDGTNTKALHPIEILYDALLK